MSSWPARIQSLNTRCLLTYGVPATLHSVSAGDVQITGIVKRMPLSEDAIPGSTQGVNSIRFFVDLAALTVAGKAPATGDTLTLNSVDYNVMTIDPDYGGGATLKLLRR
jgi:hypothetical protein